MNNDFITIREAVKLTGKADITIRRLIRQMTKQNDPETIQMIRKEKVGGSFIYKINKTYLFKELKINEPVKEQKEIKERVDKTTKKQRIEVPEMTEVLKAKNEIISILKGELYKTIGQLKTKDWQIGSLGKKMDNLIERDRETNIILKSLQDKVFLLEAPKTPENERKIITTYEAPQNPETEVRSEIKAPEQEEKAEVREEIKKKSLWQRFWESNKSI